MRQNIFKLKFCTLILLFCVCLQYHQSKCVSNTEKDTLMPSVFFAILVRNKEHALPYFFGYLERLDYPRDRISLWFVNSIF